MTGVFEAAGKSEEFAEAAVLALFETTELQLQRHQNWATVALSVLN